MALTDLQHVPFTVEPALVPRDELEAAVAQGYEATVETLLHPETAQPSRKISCNGTHRRGVVPARWGPGGRIHRTVTTQRPLEEKMTSSAWAVCYGLNK